MQFEISSFVKLHIKVLPKVFLYIQIWFRCETLLLFF